MIKIEEVRMNDTGIKHDKNKPRYDLIPPHILDEVVQVLTHGAKKYADNNWLEVDRPHTRYFAAAMRHLWAWKRGEQSDPDSGLSHLAHAICSLMFIGELEQAYEK
jgi:hypothetical protein